MRRYHHPMQSALQGQHAHTAFQKYVRGSIDHRRPTTDHQRRSAVHRRSSSVKTQYGCLVSCLANTPGQALVEMTLAMGVLLLVILGAAWGAPSWARRAAGAR